MHGHRIGYVWVNSFDPNPERQLEAALANIRRGVTDPQSLEARHDLSCAAPAHTEEFLYRRAVERILSFTKRTAPGPNTTPDHPQALVPLPKTPAAVTALPAIVRCGGPPILCQGRFFRDATHGGPGRLLQTRRHGSRGFTPC